MTVVPVNYGGPQCPRCNMPLALGALQTGTNTCDYCRRSFEATAFQPPERQRPAITEVVAVGPEGAIACANHERNAAVTSCGRCGLFICALCEMTVAEGSFCPACFDRLTAEGSLATARTRYRDYGAMARMWAIAGIFVSFGCMGITLFPFGALTVYYARRGAAQRKEEGRSIGGMIALGILGVLEVLGGIGIYIFLIWAMTKG